MNHHPSKYRAIKVWGQQLGSFHNYITKEQQLAADQGAPLDAIYYNFATDKWVTVRDITAVETLQRVAMGLAQDAASQCEQNMMKAGRKA